MKKKRKTDRQVQKIVGIVCLSFLIGTMGGALAANLLPAGEKSDLALFLESALNGAEPVSFLGLFWKYLKYDIIIWAGGWMQMGLFVSGVVFFFRSVSVGFTSAMLMAAYGGVGIWRTLTNVLPQNLFLIPAYILTMSAALYYMMHWQEEGIKRTLKREKKRKQTEYCLLFGGSVVLLAGAALVERCLLLM